MRKMKLVGGEVRRLGYLKRVEAADASLPEPGTHLRDHSSPPQLLAAPMLAERPPRLGLVALIGIAVILTRIPGFQQLTGRFIGIGLQPEHPHLTQPPR